MTARSDYRPRVSRGCARQETMLCPACACPRVAGQSTASGGAENNSSVFSPSSGSCKSAIQVLSGPCPLAGSRRKSAPCLPLGSSDPGLTAPHAHLCLRGHVTTCLPSMSSLFLEGHLPTYSNVTSSYICKGFPRGLKW